MVAAHRLLPFGVLLVAEMGCSQRPGTPLPEASPIAGRPDQPKPESAQPPTPALFATADLYRTLFVESLKRLPNFDSYQPVSPRDRYRVSVDAGPSGGFSGPVFSYRWSMRVPVAALGPRDLGQFASGVLEAWKQLGHSTQAHGGGGNVFHLRFGDDSSHAFISIVAFPEDEITRIIFIINVVAPQPEVRRRPGIQMSGED